jgi:colanic acid/amylovoran biosynthesis protein
MPEILLTFAGLSWQKGSAAQVVSLVRQLQQMRSDLRITLLSHCIDIDAGPAARLGVEVGGIPMRQGVSQRARSCALALTNLRTIGSGISRRIFSGGRPPLDPRLAAFHRADLVLDLSGDSYRDPPGGRSPAHNLVMLACKAVNRPCALMSQSLGPFRRRNRTLTRWCLNQAGLIYIREVRSFELLLDLGIDPDRLLLAPDLAFTLGAADCGTTTTILEREFPHMASLPRPWIGLSPSGFLFTRLGARRAQFQARVLAELIRHIVRRLRGTVILIPHEVSPAGFNMDDVAAANLVAQAAGCPESLRVLRGDYDPGVIKAIVSRLDALVAARMHAGIAGLSSAVPTMLVSWSHKYEGLMEQVGLAEFVWNVCAPPRHSLNELFDDLWNRRDEVRTRLRAYNGRAIPAVKAAVARGISQLP